MATFPTLNSGAVAQHPLQRQLVYSTQVVEFIDGQQQRYREYSAPLHRWVIDLSLLDPAELRALAAFFESEGVVNTFTFTDPWDKTVYGNCLIEDAQFEMKLLGEWSGQTQLTIREIRT